jgi:hypothetical protein
MLIEVCSQPTYQFKISAVRNKNDKLLTVLFQLIAPIAFPNLLRL